MRPGPLRTLLALWLSAAVVLPLQATEIRARDATTGAAVDATLTLVPDEADGGKDRSVRKEKIAGAAWTIELGAGRWRVQVRAAGYRTLELTLDSARDDLPLTLLLDPLQRPAKLAVVEGGSSASDHDGWLQGYVRRADDGAPVAGARISDGRGETRSDADGFFLLSLGEVDEAKASPLQSRPLPEELTLSVSARGFPPTRKAGLLRVAGVQTLLIALGNDEPAFSRQQVGVRDRLLGQGVGDELEGLAVPTLDHPAKAATLAPTVLPPASIRVGFADVGCTSTCGGSSCPYVCTMSLETYVRRGLDSEWIASWEAHSLRAGSIAYRSFGAWRTQHPIAAGYDICSNASCQVNHAITSASTNAAVARTPGLMLTQGAPDIFAAEYSAENNAWDNPSDGLACTNTDLSCGNGFVGSPAKNWPCLADAVATDHGCFGHGRGMSQWGSQRWANDAMTPQTWRWIVDHYYNDNGNSTGAGTGLRTSVLTTPLSLSGIVAMPAQVLSGLSTTLSSVAGNDAGEAHAHLLIGASLYDGTVGYIDDIANDTPLVLDPGSHAVQRPFHVPYGTPAGTYDLLYALWLDVDEDGLISSTDLPLAFIIEPAALEVLPSQLFADGFETP